MREPSIIDKRIHVGSVVQIDPSHDELFGGQFLVVTEVKSWGVQGYCTSPEKPHAQFFYRVAHDKIEYVGQVTWMMDTAQARREGAK